MGWDSLFKLREKLPANAVFACFTAAWIHGVAPSWPDRFEIALPKITTRRSHTRSIIRRTCLAPDEVVSINGLPVTTLHRTLRDLSLFARPLDALIVFDASLAKKRTTTARMLADRAALKGRRGAARFRRLARLAEPAESPMETRLRWLLISAGLPRPEVQIDLFDARGEFIGRADLLYREEKLVIEFDGGNHRDRLVSDDQRQNLIISAGYRILRFTGTDVYNRQDVVAAQVRGSLATPR